MNSESVAADRSKGVICIFCLTRTPLPVSFSDKKTSPMFAEWGPRISLIRCQHCGKEAPYRSIEIISLPATANYGASA